MDWNNGRHLLAYLAVAGILSYLIGAALSAVFVVSLPMSRGWCLEWQELEVRQNRSKLECVSFLNEFERAKYDYNAKMVDRNGTLLLFKTAGWFGITALLFHFIPTWKGSRQVQGRTWIAASLGIAFLVAIVIPRLMGFVLPAPYDWFPQVFRDINDSQVEAALRALRY